MHIPSMLCRHGLCTIKMYLRFMPLRTRFTCSNNIWSFISAFHKHCKFNLILMNSQPRIHHTGSSEDMHLCDNAHCRLDNSSHWSNNDGSNTCPKCVNYYVPAKFIPKKIKFHSKAGNGTRKENDNVEMH